MFRPHENNPDSGPGLYSEFLNEDASGRSNVGDAPKATKRVTVDELSDSGESDSDQDPVEEPSASDVHDVIFTFYGPKKGSVHDDGWNSFDIPVAKGRVMPPSTPLHGSKAKNGYRVVKITQVSKHAGMEKFDLPFTETYTSGPVSQTRGNLASLFDMGATEFFWSVDLIYKTRGSWSNGKVEYRFVKTSDFDLPGEGRSELEALSHRQKRARR